jgi:hypothetical protein
MVCNKVEIFQIEVEVVTNEILRVGRASEAAPAIPDIARVAGK